MTLEALLEARIADLQEIIERDAWSAWLWWFYPPKYPLPPDDGRLESPQAELARRKEELEDLRMQARWDED
jgi:ribosomal protein S12 methylthiotransferase accessory factor YcaO